MINNTGRLDHVRDKIPARVGLRRGFLLAILLATVILNGCFLDRLVTLRSQACTFDEHFEIRTVQNLEIEFHDPVFLEKDMRLIWGAAPTTISRSDKGSTLHYLFQRLPDRVGDRQTSILEEFSLEFDFTPVDGQLRLSKISSDDLPVELLSAINKMNLSGFDEIAGYACQVEVNPFTRSMLLPLDTSWFNELPTQNELIALYGEPDSSLDEGRGLVYKYRLKSSDAETHTANLVIWYDETGEQPLVVEGSFSRYQVHTDFLTAIMKVQFRI